MMGDYEKAHLHCREARKLKPDLSTAWIRQINPFKDPERLKNLIAIFETACGMRNE
jgi:hypothetical protein